MADDYLQTMLMVNSSVGSQQHMSGIYHFRDLKDMHEVRSRSRDQADGFS